MVYCTADCFADQTAFDLVRSVELRPILAAYQDEVSADKSFIITPFNMCVHESRYNSSCCNLRGHEL